MQRRNWFLIMRCPVTRRGGGEMKGNHPCSTPGLTVATTTNA